MGLVYVFTGDGKGKTSTAVGLAVRARGHDKRVVFIQFMKGLPTGEIRPLESLGVEVYRFGTEKFVDFNNPSEEDKKLAKQALEKAREKILEKPFLVILDEINVAIAAGLIPLEEVIALIESLPEETNLVLTGRYAKEELIRMADLVTEMKEIKHYFKKGVSAKKGIDY